MHVYLLLIKFVYLQDGRRMRVGLRTVISKLAES